MKTKFQFMCPDCGGHTYGTVTVKATEPARRNCHGRRGTGCGFTWFEEADYKYLVFIQTAETPEEFREMLDKFIKERGLRTEREKSKPINFSDR